MKKYKILNRSPENQGFCVPKWHWLARCYFRAQKVKIIVPCHINNRYINNSFEHLVAEE